MAEVDFPTGSGPSGGGSDATSIQGVPVPAPTTGYLHFDGVDLEWIAIAGGVSDVLGSTNIDVTGTTTKTVTLVGPIDATLFANGSVTNAEFQTLDGIDTGTPLVTQLAGKLATNGNGSALTNLNASALTSGTVDVARLPTAVQFANDLTSGAQAQLDTKLATNGNAGSLTNIPAAQLAGDVALARIATSLAAGGGAVKGTVVTATTRIETPTVGTSSATQHALPAGTADILTADSTATVTGKSIDAGQLTGNVLVARIATALAAGGNPITGTVLTASTRVEAPTIGTASGAQHALPSGTEEILAPPRGTAGQVLTSNGAGSAPSMAAPITATTGSATLSGTFLITGASGVYQDSGLSLSLPAAGTYLLFGRVLGNVNVLTGAPGFVSAKFYNVTAAADVANSQTLIALIQIINQSQISTAPMFAVVTVAGATTIALYAARNLATTYNSSELNSSSSGYTQISYLKIGP